MIPDNFSTVMNNQHRGKRRTIMAVLDGGGGRNSELVGTRHSETLQIGWKRPCLPISNCIGEVPRLQSWLVHFIWEHAPSLDRTGRYGEERSECGGVVLQGNAQGTTQQESTLLLHVPLVAVHHPLNERVSGSNARDGAIAEER